MPLRILVSILIISQLFFLSCSSNDKSYHFIESLKNCKTDSCRADLLYLTGKSYREDDWDMCLKYMDSTYNLAKKINYEGKVLSALIVRASIYSNQRNFEKTDSIYNILRVLTDKIDSLKSVNKVGELDLMYWKNMIDCSLASHLFRKHELDLAQQYYLNCLESLDTTVAGYLSKRCQVLTNLGVVKVNKIQYKEALAYLKDAENCIEESGSSLSQKYYIYNELGILFKRVGDFETSLNYFGKAYRSTKKSSPRHYSTMYNIANALYSAKKTDIAGKTLNELYNFHFKKLGPTTQCNTISLLVKYHIEKGLLDEAERLNNEQLECLESNNYQQAQSNYYINRGMIEQKKENFDEAYIQFFKAKDTIQKYGIENFMMYYDLLDDLVKISLKTSNTKDLEALYNEHTLYRDSLTKITLRDKVQKWDEQRMVEEKNILINELNIELNRIEENRSKQKRWLAVLGVAILLILISLGYLYNKKLRKLEGEKNLLREQNKSVTFALQQYKRNEITSEKLAKKELSIQSKKIPLDRIYYIEYRSGILTLYTEKGNFKDDKSLQSWQEYLAFSPDFMRISRFVIINLNNVEKRPTYSELIMKNGDKVTKGRLSKNLSKDLNEALKARGIPTTTTRR